MADLPGWNAANKIRLTVDKDKVDGNLSNFPVRINLDNPGSGEIDFTPVFNDITPIPSPFVMDDDFTDGTIGLQWKISGSYTTEAGGKLNVDIPTGTGGFTGSGYDSQFYVSGDFSVEVSFDSYSWSSGTENRALLDFTVDSDNFARVYRRTNSSVEEFTVHFNIGGTSTSYTLFDSTTFGGFRIIRSSDTVSGYIKVGAGSWTLITDGTTSTETGFSLNRGYIQLWGYGANANDSVSVDFDDFVINSGTIEDRYWGSDGNKKIAVTTDNGTTECYVEIDNWDPINKTANLWFEAPSVSSSSNQIFYLYYDSAHADNTTYVGDTGDAPAQQVWDANFKAVYHMNQEPIPETALVTDTFTDTNGTLLQNHASDLGGGWTKATAGVDLEINSNQLSLPSGTGASYTHTYGNVADGYIEWDVITTGSNQLYFRYTDANNHYRVLTYVAGNLYIYKVLLGSQTTVLFLPVALGATPYTLRVYFIGSDFTVFENDILIGSASDTSHSTGKIGVRQVNLSVMDNFEIGTLAEETLLDSTVNSITGTPHGSMDSSDLVDAQIGKGIDFDGTDDVISFGSDSALMPTAAITVEAIGKNAGVNGAYVSKPAGTAAPWNNYFVGSDATQAAGFLMTSGGNTTLTYTTTPTVFHDVALTYNGSTAILYVGGVSRDTDSGVSGNILYDMNGTYAQVVSGAWKVDEFARECTVDEIRISDIARSPEWVKATHYSNVNTLFLSQVISAIRGRIVNSGDLGGATRGDLLNIGGI